MYTTQLLLFLLAVSNTFSSHVITVHDIFPEELIKAADEAEHHPDWGLDIVQFLEKYGYPLESHHVTTEDGYILTMHRIPYGRNETPTNRDTSKPPILLMHGLLSSSIDWVNMGTEKSIGLLLADRGYDVWLGNNRGNMWSRYHTTLDPDTDKTFWDYSFDDCGYYDIPAKINYILNMTGYEKLSYIGHSQGTTQFFAMGALRPEYNEKINLMLAFAPVAYMQNLSHPLVAFLSEYWLELEITAELLNFHEILPHTQLITDGVGVLCNNNSPLLEICADLFYFIGGSDPPQFNKSFIEVITSNAPMGVSMRMIGHYIQEYQSGYFRRYDYGAIKNLEVYRQFVPPNYKVSSITAPVALYYSKNDIFSAVVNVQQLAAELPNVVVNHLIEYELFTHLDFLWALDVDTLLNNDAIELLNQYNNM